MYQLKICKKITNVTPCGAYFERSCKTPLSNFATEVDSKKRNYETIIDEHLQEETKTRRSHLVEEQFTDTGNSSGIEIERLMCTAIKIARDMQKKCKTANNGYSGQIMSRN